MLVKAAKDLDTKKARAEKAIADYEAAKVAFAAAKASLE